jgi:hypothetical protein
MKQIPGPDNPPGGRNRTGTFARAFPNDAELPGLGRPGASPSGFDLVGLAADLVTPARWATIGGQCTTFVTALETVRLVARLGICHPLHAPSR